MTIKKVILRLSPRRRDPDNEVVIKDMNNKDLLNYVKNHFSAMDMIEALGYNYRYRCRILKAKWLKTTDHILPIEFDIMFEEDVSDEDFLDTIVGDSLEDGVYGSSESNGWVNYCGENDPEDEFKKYEYDVFLTDYRRNDITINETTYE